MGSMQVARWLTFIQGKDVSARVLAEIKDAVGDTGGNRRLLMERIKAVIAEKGFQVDANYVYANMSGMHIAPMDLATENAALAGMQAVVDALGEERAARVPMLYMLRVVSERDGLGVVVQDVFTKEKAEVFDNILKEAGVL